MSAMAQARLAPPLFDRDPIMEAAPGRGQRQTRGCSLVWSAAVLCSAAFVWPAFPLVCVAYRNRRNKSGRAKHCRTPHQTPNTTGSRGRLDSSGSLRILPGHSWSPGRGRMHMEAAIRRIRVVALGVTVALSAAAHAAAPPRPEIGSAPSLPVPLGSKGPEDYPEVWSEWTAVGSIPHDRVILATPKHASPREAAIVLGSTADGKEAVDAWRREGKPEPSPLPTLPAIATDQGADSDIEELETCYRERGFLDVRVSCLRTTRDGAEVAVVYRVHEGPRYSVQTALALADLQTLVWLSSVAQISESGALLPDQRGVIPDIERLKRWAAIWGGQAEVKTTWVKSTEEPGRATLRFEVRFTQSRDLGLGFSIGPEPTF